jgi:hypothetical protein
MHPAGSPMELYLRKGSATSGASGEYRPIPHPVASRIPGGRIADIAVSRLEDHVWA